jgi:hypothetical protein
LACIPSALATCADEVFLPSRQFLFQGISNKALDEAKPRCRTVDSIAFLAASENLIARGWIGPYSQRTAQRISGRLTFGIPLHITKGVFVAIIAERLSFA